MRPTSSRRTFILKSIVGVLMVIGFLGLSSPAFADYQSQSRVTALNKFTDFFATVGKSDTQKKQIINNRKHLRQQYRQQKEQLRVQKNTQKRMQKQQKEIMQKVNSPYSR